MVDLQCMVSYVKWLKAGKNGDFSSIESGVSKEYPFLLELKVKGKLFTPFYSKCIFHQDENKI